MHVSVAKKCSLIWRDILKNSRTQKCFNWTDEYLEIQLHCITIFLFWKWKNVANNSLVSRFPFQTENHRSCYQSMASLWMRYFIKVWHHSEWDILSKYGISLNEIFLVPCHRSLLSEHCWTRGNTLCILGSDSLPQGTSEARKAGKGRLGQTLTWVHLRIWEGGCAETRCYANWSLGHAHETSAKKSLTLKLQLNKRNFI